MMIDSLRISNKPAKNLGSARVGCSGWEFKHWRGDFCPAELPRTRWFEHYTRTFDTVEINNTFYRLPEESTFARWAELNQLPPGWKLDRARLEHFLQALQSGVRHVLGVAE